MDSEILKEDNCVPLGQPEVQLFETGIQQPNCKSSAEFAENMLNETSQQLNGSNEILLPEKQQSASAVHDGQINNQTLETYQQTASQVENGSKAPNTQPFVLPENSVILTEVEKETVSQNTDMIIQEHHEVAVEVMVEEGAQSTRVLETSNVQTENVLQICSVEKEIQTDFDQIPTRCVSERIPNESSSPLSSSQDILISTSDAQHPIEQKIEAEDEETQRNHNATMEVEQQTNEKKPVTGVDQKNSNKSSDQNVECPVKEENAFIEEQNGRFTRIKEEGLPHRGICQFLGGKSLQLTNINDTSRLFAYFFGTKVQRLLVKKANANLIELKRTKDLKEFTVDEVSVFIALKIVMGLQQNSSNFEFFMLKDLQSIPAYSSLFSNDRFQFLIDCERELNKDIINNEQLTIDFSTRSQNAQTSEQELAVVMQTRTDIIHNNSAYQQIYLTEVSTGYIFGYYLVKDIASFANGSLLSNLDSFMGVNHIVYLHSELFFKGYSSVPDFLKQRIHLSTYSSVAALPSDLSSLLKVDQTNYITESESPVHLVHRVNEKGKDEVYLTTTGHLSSDNSMMVRHSNAIKKTCEKLHQQLIEYRFLNVWGEQSIFEELTEMAILNAFVIYKQAKEKIDFRLFRQKLALELLQKQINFLKLEDLKKKNLKKADAEVQTEACLQNQQSQQSQQQQLQLSQQQINTMSSFSSNNTKINSNQIQDVSLPTNNVSSIQQPTIVHVPQAVESNSINSGNNKLVSVGESISRHTKKRNDKKGLCFYCLEEKDAQNFSYITCHECDANNRNQIFFCETCFDPYHSNPNNLRFDLGDPNQYQRLSGLKSPLVSADKKQQPIVPGGFTQPFQTPITAYPQAAQGYPVGPAGIRRRRGGVYEAGYETSGPSFNGLINPALKRRGPILEDPGFRSDAPSSYLPNTSMRGRKRINPGGVMGYSDYTEPAVYNNQHVPVTQGYQRFATPAIRPQMPDMNGYMTSDPSYGRSYTPQQIIQQPMLPNQGMMQGINGLSQIRK